MIVDASRRWVDYEDLALDESDFDAIGEAFASAGGERNGNVGAGVGRLFSQRAIVDFGVEWIERNRR